MKEVSKKEMVRPSLQVWGVKKRCRKVDFHSFNLKSREPDAVNLEELKAICEQAIKKYMRTVKKAHLSLQPQTVTTYDDGSEVNSYMLFSDEKIELEVNQ